MEINGETDTTAPFCQVMQRVTEQALRYGLEENVMAALFDVLDAAAQARDKPQVHDPMMGNLPL
jgi:hypothetical protein